MTLKRSVFFISDSTGITAETLGRSLLTQFEGMAFRFTSWPFIDNLEKAAGAVERINQAAREDGVRPLLLSTLVSPEVREMIKRSDGLLFDFFETFNQRLEATLGARASTVMGRSHGMGDYARYTARMDALNFALNNDDGMGTGNYPAADIVLVGVSRSGKTPTCLYLALQYGVLAANYPLTEEDLGGTELPLPLRPYQDRLFGLTIEPQRLHQIRSERRPDSRYATLGQCRFEVQAVETLYHQHGIPLIDTTNKSIEEIATTILQQAGLTRRLYG